MHSVSMMVSLLSTLVLVLTAECDAKTETILPGLRASAPATVVITLAGKVRVRQILKQ